MLTEKASQSKPVLVSVADSSPAHGESQDEVLKRRHGDKEVIFFIFKQKRHELNLPDSFRK